MNTGINSEATKECGWQAGIIILDIAHWIAHNKAAGHNIHDGKAWTYNTAEAYSKLYKDFGISMDSAKRALKKLVVAGYLEKGEYNKSPYDRTAWYTLTEKGEKSCNLDYGEEKNNVDSESANLHNREGGDAQSVERICPSLPTIHTTKYTENRASVQSTSMVCNIKTHGISRAMTAEREAELNRQFDERAKNQHRKLTKRK